MKEIEEVIQTLTRHQFRSVSNVVGEFVEKKIAEMVGGTQARHCQKGFDVLCSSLGRVEVKSRNADAKSMRCTLPEHKLLGLDNFILAIVKNGKIERVIVFSREILLRLKSGSGVVYIDKQHFDIGRDITAMLTDDMAGRENTLDA